MYKLKEIRSKGVCEVIVPLRKSIVWILLEYPDQRNPLYKRHYTKIKKFLLMTLTKSESGMDCGGVRTCEDLIRSLFYIVFPDRTGTGVPTR